MTTNPVLHGCRFRALLLSAIGCLAFSLGGGWHEVGAALVTVGYFGSLIALRLSLVNYLLRFVRWQIFLAQMNHRVYWQESLRIYIAGFGLTILPAKAGVTIRSVFLKKHSVSCSGGLSAFFSEQLSNLISILFLVTVGLWAYSQEQAIVFILVGGFILTILIVLQLGGLTAGNEKFEQKNSHGIWQNSLPQASKSCSLQKAVSAYCCCFIASSSA